MKKILVLISIVFLLSTVTAVAVSKEIIVFEVTNSGGTYQSTSVSTDTIRPRKAKIYAVTVGLYDSDTTDSSEPNHELVVGLYDAVPDGTGGDVAEMIAEAEARSGETKTKIGPYGKTVYNQLIVNQGGCTIVTIEYAP